MTNRLRIAFATPYDPLDPASWSGTPRGMIGALEAAGAEVVVVGPLRRRAERLVRTRARVARRVAGHRFHPELDPVYGRGWADQLADRLADIRPDVILSPGTIPFGERAFDRPVVFWPDAAFASVLGVYEQYTDLPPRTVARFMERERMAFARATLAMFPSEWAATAVIQHCNLPRARVRIVPYGANVERPLAADDVARVVEERGRQECRLLFIGADWRRKGGDMAVAVTRELRRRGIEATLTVLGDMPAQAAVSAGNLVRRAGYVDKRTPEGRRAVERELARSHLLLLPSRADCSPIALREAAAFAVPAFATRVGGIPDIVRDEESGATFPLHAGVDAWCDRIERELEPERYVRLADRSFGRYLADFSWDRIGARALAVLEEAAGRVAERVALGGPAGGSRLGGS